MAMAQAAASSIGAHQLLVFLLQIGLLLGAAILLGRLAAKAKLPPLVGELTAGVLLGPSVFGNLLPDVSRWLLPQEPGQMQLLSAVAQLGLLLLVAVTGAHVDLGLIRRRRRAIGLVSVGSVALPLALGCLLGFLLPDALMAQGANRGAFALFVGVAIAVSALPVISKTLLDMGLMHRDVGQMTIGAAAVSDVIGWLLLSVVSAMVTSSAVSAGVIFRTVGYLLAVLVLTVLVMRPAARWLLRRAERSGQPGLGVAVIVVLVVLAAAGTHALGLEPILGAFLGGLIISSLGAPVRRVLDSMRPLIMAALVPLYFVMAGLRVELSAFGDPAILLATAVTILVATLAKFAGGYAGARLGRIGHREALAIGAGLNARGVVEIVVATVGLQLGILTSATYAIVVLLAVLTSVMAPPMLRLTLKRTPASVAEQEREREFIHRFA
ncbi:MAG TPA: cation:proton antiporter [Amycolatopsis sp.]|uniref:cation:proton antiporter n=1 Tax=Amycolatopsis sp. TaxID=37632 RepID=UPI002B464E4A|nr:cation:proton antiporter [Amycolatopsis sp.]HKS44181.1 cation:proton antiporter [Amycolatopsis sp.]